MKVLSSCLLLLSGVGPIVAQSDSERPSGQEVLSAVVTRLPRDPLAISGNLTVRKRRGVIVRELRFDMRLNWGADTPSATYEIRDSLGGDLERMIVTRSAGGEAIYRHLAGTPLREQKLPDLTQPIQGTDIGWSDLTLDFLWWKPGDVLGTEDIRGRECYRLDVRNPRASAGNVQPGSGAAPAYERVRLWIDRHLYMLLQAEALDPGGKAVRRLWVRSVKKINERWIIKDLEVEGFPAEHRTRLDVRDVSPAAGL